jgi:hypothetical protein
MSFWELFEGKRARAATAEKTRLLRAAVKTQLAPFIMALGFRKNAKSYACRPIDGPLGNTFSRARGDYVDEIQIEWATYQRPQFTLNFWSDQIDRMLDPDRETHPSGLPRSYHAALYPGRARWRPRWYNRVFWHAAPPRLFGERMAIEATIDIAKARVAELDHHLKVGAPTIHMDLVRDVIVKRADPSNARPIPPPAVSGNP